MLAPEQPHELSLAQPAVQLSPPVHAYTPVKQRATNYSAVTNPYGLLRSPWNSFRAPHVTRYRKTDGGVVERELPGCDVFQACFRSNATSRMNQCMAGATHGDVHLMIGGVWAHADLESLLLELAVPRAMYNQFFFVTKNLWRFGLVRTPAYCSMDTPEAECRTFCPAALWAGRNRTGLELLVEARQMHFIDQWSNKIFYDESRQA